MEDFFDKVEQELAAVTDETRATLELLFEPGGERIWLPPLTLRHDQGVQDQLIKHLRVEHAKPGTYKARLRLNGKIMATKTGELAFRAPDVPPPVLPAAPAPVAAGAPASDEIQAFLDGAKKLRKAQEAFAELAGPDEEDDEDEEDEDDSEEEERAAAEPEEPEKAPWWVEMFLAPFVPALSKVAEAGAAALENLARQAAAVPAAKPGAAVSAVAGAARAATKAVAQALSGPEAQAVEVVEGEESQDELAGVVQ